MGVTFDAKRHQNRNVGVDAHIDPKIFVFNQSPLSATLTLPLASKGGYGGL